jgi:hypothetical protein
VRPTSGWLRELEVNIAPLLLIEYEDTDLFVVLRLDCLRVFYVVVCEEGSDEGRIRPVEERGGVSMMLNQIEERSILAASAPP